jgi:cytochrome c553
VKKIFTPFLATAALALAVITLAGCASSPGHHATPAHAGSTDGGSPGGARLWAQNCTRCHNSRSPSSYSNAQWEVAMLHMRVRANLTAEEHKAILEFLQTGH